MFDRYFITTIVLIFIIFTGDACALSKSDILKNKEIIIVPAIVLDEKVFIKPLNTGVKFSRKSFLLLGDDGQNYELKISHEKVKKYPKLNWGFGNSEAISLVGTGPVSAKGSLVAIGDVSQVLLKWFPAIELQKCITNPNSNLKSNNYLSTDNLYGTTSKITYKNNVVPGELFYAEYTKLKPKPCDAHLYKQTIGIITHKGETASLLDSFYDCDGQPADNNSAPIGPILGVLEIKDESKMETWIVIKGHGYEAIGITLIPYDLKINANSRKNTEFILMDGL